MFKKLIDRFKMLSDIKFENIGNSGLNVIETIKTDLARKIDDLNYNKNVISFFLDIF